MTGLECGHVFCKNCWTEYLTTKIMDEGASQSIECPGSACNILVDDQTVMNLVKEPKTKLKYQQLITNSFVQVRSFFSLKSWFCITCFHLERYSMINGLEKLLKTTNLW